MTIRLCIEVRPARGQRSATVAQDVLYDRWAGFVVPRHEPLRGDDVLQLLSDERYDERIAATHSAATTRAHDIVDDLSGPDGTTRVYWCSFEAAFPSEGGFVRGPLFRFGPPPDGRAPLLPVATLFVDAESLRLHLGVNGAPLLVPGSQTAEGPYGTMVAQARQRLGESLAGLQTSLLGEGVTPESVAELADSLGIGKYRSTGKVGRPSANAGPCVRCRHANQLTTDLREEELLFCKLGSQGASLDASCDVRQDGRWAYEPFDGANGTWRDAETPTPLLWPPL